MKVCHMTSAHDNTDTRIFYRECRSLAAAGYEVYLVAAGVNLPYLGIKRLLGEELPACEIKYGTRMSRRLQESFFDPDDRPIAW